MKRAVVLLLFLGIILPGCPTPFTLGYPGAFEVKRLYLSDVPGVDPIAIHYPVSDVPLKDLPVIILNTGWNQPRLSYEGYATQFAQWGYVCVTKFVAAAGLTGIGDAMVDEHVIQNMTLLNWVAAQNADPESPLFEMADTDNAGVAGHSLGAGIAIDSAIADDRFKVGISIDGNFPGPEFDPRPFLPEEDAAIMFFYGTEGRWCSGQRFTAPRLWEFTSAPSIEVSVIGAGHIDFMDSLIGLTYAAPFVCPSGSQDPQVIRDTTTRYMIGWCNVWLKGEMEFEDIYNGESSASDEAAGLVALRRKLGE